jgi:UDP-N-acetylmuramyl pentapeptide phosphotransferase/UDP-N-acetylglucosamine-1-phosphate transferase
MAILALIPLLLALVLTPLMARAMGALGLVGRPDSARKTRGGPVPRGGGVAVAIAYLVTLMLSGAEFGAIWRLLPAAGLVLLVGIADDLCDLRPWQELAGRLWRQPSRVRAGSWAARFRGGRFHWRSCGCWPAATASI